MIIIIVFIVFLISIIICLIIFVLRQLFRSRSISRQEHNNVEYVMLQNFDDHDEEEETKSNSINGHIKPISPIETTISMNHIEET